MVERETDWWNPDTRRAKLELVRQPLQMIIDEAGIPRLQGDLIPNPFYFSLQSRSVGFVERDEETFTFSGEVLIRGKPDVAETANSPTAVIRTLMVPAELTRRKIGLGTRLVTAWEDAWKSMGITSFAVSSVIQHPDTLRFWRKLGYAPSESHPTHMYKKF